MSKCGRLRPLLDEFALGARELPPEDREHVRSCASCGEAFRRAEAMRKAMEMYVASLDAPDRGFEEEIYHRVRERIRRRRPWRAWTFGALSAAAAILAVALSWPGWHSVAGPSAAQLEMIAAVEKEATRDEVADYLAQAHFVLLSVLYSHHECDGDGVELDVEREIAQSLLLQKRLIDPQLALRGNENLRNLCDDLDLVLTDLAAAGNCVDEEEIRLWKKILDSKSTLLKLNLAQREVV